MAAVPTRPDCRQARLPSPQETGKTGTGKTGTGKIQDRDGRGRRARQTGEIDTSKTGAGEVETGKTGTGEIETGKTGAGARDSA